MWNHASKGLGDAFILGSTQGSSELRHGLNFGEAEHCLRCCAGTSSPLSSVLDESGGFESQCLDAFCGHTGLMEVARGLAGLQESLSDCKKPQEGTVLCLFFKFYTHTHVCVCISMYLETAWFLHFICGRSITTLFFLSKLCPLTGEA